MYMLILNFTYPLRCLRVPPVEYHWAKRLLLIKNSLISMGLLWSPSTSLLSNSKTDSSSRYHSVLTYFHSRVSKCNTSANKSHNSRQILYKTSFWKGRGVNSRTQVNGKTHKSVAFLLHLNTVIKFTGILGHEEAGAANPRKPWN